jgi:hypothetical protein
VPAVKVELAGQDFTGLLVSTPDAQEVAARLGAGGA